MNKADWLAFGIVGLCVTGIIACALIGHGWI